MLLTLTALLLMADTDGGIKPADGGINAVDALWPRRDDPQVAAQITTAVAAFGAGAGYDELWRASRWEAWQALGTVGDQKKRHAKAGWDLGERAHKLRPEGLEGLYWTAINLGIWGSVVSILEAIGAGIEAKYRDPLWAVIKADPDCREPNVEYVGPEVALGHFYYKIPWPKQDKGKARELLARAVRAHPENLRAHLLYADVLKDDDQAAARKELQIVLDGGEAYDPPDARRDKAWAREMLGKLH